MRIPSTELIIALIKMYFTCTTQNFLCKILLRKTLLYEYM